MIIDNSENTRGGRLFSTFVLRNALVLTGHNHFRIVGDAEVNFTGAANAACIKSLHQEWIVN